MILKKVIQVLDSKSKSSQHTYTDTLSVTIYWILCRPNLMVDYYIYNITKATKDLITKSK